MTVTCILLAKVLVKVLTRANDVTATLPFIPHDPAFQHYVLALTT